MKIAAATLFLAVAVSLDFIELISSVEPPYTTLALLFPEYEQRGYLPPVQVNTNRAILRSTSFKQIGNHILHRPDHAPPFLRRGHVIFAWKGDHRNLYEDWQGDYIEPLWRLFPWLLEPKRWVFNIAGNHWVTLIENEFDKLGFGHVRELVSVQQQTALAHMRTTDNPIVDTRAHCIAYFRANEAIDMLQDTEAEKIYWGQSTVDISSRLIRRRYKMAYNRVFHEIAGEPGHLVQL